MNPSLLEQTATSIRFQVDDVVPVIDLLPKESLQTHLQGRLQHPLIAHSHPDSTEVLSGETVHPLAAAVHLAFSHHRPLILTPDIIWLTIAQGFSHHINHHGEHLRDRFVQHEGQLKLEVRTQSTAAIEDWQKAINDWTLQIRDHVGADLHRQIICNFSTTTPITQTASQVVLMDSFKQYFDYVLTCICGIPWVELQGTSADWEEIRDRVKFIAQYDLDWWCDRLLPICEGFIATAQGNPLQSFWQQIYKPQEVYGGDMITGWLGDLFPYLKSEISGLPLDRNPMLDVPRSEIISSQSNPQSQIHGIRSSQIPIGLSQVPFTMITMTAQQTLNLFAGFVGLQQSEIGAIYPEIGWGICALDEFTQLLDRLAETHLTQPASDWQQIRMDGVPKEMFQVLDRFNGITLFPNTDHSWQLIDAAMLDFLYNYEVIDGNTDLDASRPIATLTPCMMLKDGRCIAIAIAYSSEDLVYWIVVGRPIDRPCELGEDQERLPFVKQRYILMEDMIAIAQGVPQLFERIVQSDGQYYFDNPSFQAEIAITEIFT